MSAKQFTADVRLTRITTNDPESAKRPIRITVTDQASRLDVIEIRLTQAELGALVSGDGTWDHHTETGPQVEVRDWDYMGKRHEHLSEEFHRPGLNSTAPSAQEQADAWGEQMLAEGWDIYSSHLTNRASVKGTVRRYV